MQDLQKHKSQYPRKKSALLSLGQIKYRMVKAISLDPKATTEASKADVCLLYKHYRKAQKHKQKVDVNAERIFPSYQGITRIYAFLAYP